MSQKTYDSVDSETFSPRNALAACVSNISIKDPSLFKIHVNKYCTNLVLVPVSFALLGISLHVPSLQRLHPLILPMVFCFCLYMDQHNELQY